MLRRMLGVQSAQPLYLGSPVDRIRSGSLKSTQQAILRTRLGSLQNGYRLSDDSREGEVGPYHHPAGQRGQEIMVQEAEFAISLFHALPNMHGNRVDLWIRLSDDQRPPDRPAMEGILRKPGRFPQGHYCSCVLVGSYLVSSIHPDGQREIW